MILIFFCGRVLLKVDAQHPLGVLLVRKAGLKTLIFQAVLYPGEVGVQVSPLLIPQANQHEELAGGGHLDLQAVQGLGVRLQQPADNGQFLLGSPLAVVALVVFKALLGVEGQHLDLRLPLEDGHEGVDAVAYSLRRLDGQVGGLDGEEDQPPVTGLQAAVCDLVDANKLPCGLLLLASSIFLLFAQNGSPLSFYLGDSPGISLLAQHEIANCVP